MKKMMVAACAIAFAAMTQAAMIDWGVEAGSFTKANGDGAASMSVMLLQFDKESEVAAAWTALAAGGSVASYTAIDTQVTGSGKKDTGYIEATGIENVALVEGAEKYYALFVQDGDKFLLSTAQTGIAYDPDGSIETEGTPAAFTGGDFDMESTEQLGSWSTATATPEPTSGLLLLIGMAGLALRRRRA